MPTIWDFSLLIIILVGALIVRNYLPAYASEKGKNLATREDIAKITEEIKPVETAYGKDIEKLKSELQAANQHIQAELDKTVLVHRVQFETEFNALSEVWAKLSILRPRMVQLRPRGDIVDVREDRLQTLQRRYEDFNKARREFVSAVDDRRPFYAENIFEELSHLVLIAIIEKEDVELNAKHEPDAAWYDRGERNLEDLLTRAETVAGLIRARIAELAVIKHT